MKPYRFVTGSLSSSDNNSTFANHALPTAITALEPYASKLKGFLGMRADICVRFQVNANKFQQGRYILAFCPMVGSGTNNSEVSTNMRYANLTTITQLPHVEIDLSMETEAILRIPYVSVSSHLPIVPFDATVSGLLGYLRIFPYSPLVSVAGSTTASYNLYVNFENIHLAAPVVPQSGKFNPVTREQANKGAGPVETTSRKVAKVANLIGDKVPALSWLTAPVSWASDLLAGVSSVFGWSKPINLDKNYRTIKSSAPYMTNCDAIDNSYSLSLFAQNQVEIFPGFAGNDLDEMNIDFIKSIPAWFTTVTWSTTNVSGDVLLDVPVRPTYFETSFASGGGTVLCATPMTALANMFGLCRGGIRLIFKIVKTEFHSGRVAITFNPLRPDAPNSTTSVIDAPYVHREILDIREGNSFEFIVPYVSLTPYRGVGEIFSNVTMTVINPLIAPGTVSSSVRFLVEVAGAPDMEFAFPQWNQVGSAPVTVFNPQSSTFIPKPDKNSITTAVLGRSSLIHDEHMSSRACIGEKVKSVLSLLKRNNFVFAYNSVNNSLDPFTVFTGSTTSAVAATAPAARDPYNHISSWYALSRGSVRLKYVPITNTTLPTRATLTYAPSGTYNSSLAGVLRDNNSLIITPGDTASEIQVPQYLNTHSRSVAATMGGGILNNNHSDLGASTSIVTFIGDTTPSTYNIYRSVGDDFQLGYFIGIPPLFLFP